MAWISRADWSTPVSNPDHFHSPAMENPMRVKAMKSGAVEFLTKPFLNATAGCNPPGVGA